MLCDVKNKPENRPYLNAAEYFKATEDRKRTPIDYRVSPVNPEESDADLSDNDPTFAIQAGRKVIKRTSSSSSCSSSTSNSSSSSSDTSSNETENPNDKENTTPEETRQFNQEGQAVVTVDNVADVTMTKGRKRLRQPENWKQNKAKKLRNLGKAYINSKNTITKARQLKPPCNDTCKLRCISKINPVQRQSIFDTYWAIGDIHNQRSFILSCLTNITPRYKYTNALVPRNANKAFHFIVDGRAIRVCKTFFLNTLDISDRMIRTIKSKTDEHGILRTDFRGMTSR